MEGPRIVQQCNGKVEKRLAKAMHREARKCYGLEWNCEGTALYGKAENGNGMAKRRVALNSNGME